ncbi:uncharacterized protein SPPG_09569 [Spizellomyces punctatus DAOM BR117]|uniref:Cytosol aminopeptidase domain-containing protein n=1 Tax=Spizellomyces punctatus (strain DAOM BR117) TaxID=645134 RepID=A0A0L0H3S8_SPIPD|nr:uncharacterized protein SPPG_09569 [Spizellomyces punctatus DAOM BR117]KNC95862.1 hypothetical protein SPPG_09569 [Spizellomyces punctatus DAOM BR117]|eukprot:XP_016603902.1 hypothetical protein SPPG_09569 [Spizellomyces punctatus DAOM BR117]
MTTGTLLLRRCALRPARRSVFKVRGLSSTPIASADATVIGVYQDGNITANAFAGQGAKMPSQAVDSIVSQLNISRFQGKNNEVRLLYGLEGAPSPIVGVVGLGKRSQDNNENAETARLAASAALSAIKRLSPKSPISVEFDALGSSLATAEGATLGTYDFTRYKEEKAAPVTISLREEHAASEDWHVGSVNGQAQNLARTLAETPANLLTPTLFCDRAKELFAGQSSVELAVHDKAWAEEQQMGAFLGVARGSEEPLRFLEIIYRGGNEQDAPVALVGKGVTFDSGGISIKPSTDMALMKGDMGGAAAVLGAMWGITQLRPQVNVVAVIPLTENMPSGRATKPGDLVRARNGKTIEVDNTDAEGRLILADAIHYVTETYTPHTVVELSTLTGAMDIALGEGYAGVFSTSDTLWEQLENAGKTTGDRFWKMPMDDVYKKQLKSNVADLKNVGGRSAGSCTAAVFLKEFVPGLRKADEGISSGDSTVRFAHIDIAGVMHKKGGDGYISSGMTGRPTRSIIEFVRSISK